jgi:hypothetical protein
MLKEFKMLYYVLVNTFTIEKPSKMEKYVTAHNDSKSSTGSMDLLTMLKQKAQYYDTPVVKVEPSASCSRSSVTDSLKNKRTENNQNNLSNKINESNCSETWEMREKASISLMDLTGQQRLQQMQAKNFTGWKIDRDGAKVYTTFRNGERVQAAGQQGFMLAYGDGAIKKKAKDKSKRPIDEIETYVAESTGSKPKKQVTDYFTSSK